MKRILTVLAVTSLATLLLGTPAHAKKKKGFKTGTYVGKLSFDPAEGTFEHTTFKFRVFKGWCYKYGSGRRWPSKGYCIESKSLDPVVPLDCGDQIDGLKDVTWNVLFPAVFRVGTKTGKVHLSFNEAARDDEGWRQFTTNIWLRRNGTASGDFQVTAQLIHPLGTLVCPSKTYSFTAERRARR